MKQESNETIKNVKKEALREIKKITSFGKIETLRIKYLGRKGKLNLLFKKLPKLSFKERKTAGKLINKIKKEVEKALEEKEKKLRKQEIAKLREEFFDPTLPSVKPAIGHLHLVTQAIREISEIFNKIGYVRASYPEVEYDFYAFEALNMPKNHPARDEWETFFVNLPAHASLGEIVLTPHTSNGQVREMKRLGKPPVRMLNIGKCYRRQSDVSHLPMFHQFETLTIERDLSIPDLKGMVEYFVAQFFGRERQVRFRPFHFQFTEPSFEIDISCDICQGAGCRFCKSGWVELAGAGMVHPNVLRAGGVNPKKYTGFASGWGVERTYLMKQGLKIDDLRILYSNNLRFLEQF